MAKQYKGSLTLDWFNKQKSIINLDESDAIKSSTDISIPLVNWINKEDALFYDVSEVEGKGNRPYWVDRNDIRVKEARPLIFQKGFRAVEKDKTGSIPGTNKEWVIEETDIEMDVEDVDNILIKGDNLLALNTLKKHFVKKPENKRVKCIYIDPPYNTGKAFENYDDNLEASTWLTLMRDRLVGLRNLLSNDGVLFIQLDEKFIFYIKVMLDDIFGKHNFLNFFTIKTSDPSGFKTVNPSPYDASEYIIMYAKNKAGYKYETIYVPSEHDWGYNKYITNIEDGFENWNVIGLNQFIAERENFKDTREAKKALGEVVFNSMVSEFAINNPSLVYQGTAIGNDAGSDMIELREKSKKEPNKFQRLVRPSGNIEYAINGRQVYFYSNKIKVINGIKTPTKQLTNIWTDIPYNGISGEGDVDFAESKKPEKLIRRILEIANISKGDIVLDSFSGSGTTISVAHKMGANWVGIEIGNHTDTHIVNRLKNVISGNDKSGVSTELSFNGGGSFKYYHLGSSIINVDKETGKGEFNWALGKKFIQDSLLMSYDFVINTELNLFPNQLFISEKDKPTLGKLTGNNGLSIYGLASLAEPEDRKLTITNEEVKTIYSSIKKQPDFQSLIIFTNKGIDIASDSIPADMEITKVPNAVFTELER